MKRFFGPGLVLFFLSPVVGEMLSGSQPPAHFFTCFDLIALPILYGGGAILVRELTLRWGKGWPTLLVLGAAYGIIEEGLMCKSFFNPYWPDVGIMGVYGRWGGVNWLWSLELTIYHATVSIAIPILLVGLLFPARRGEPWAGRRTLILLAVLFLADVVVGFLFFGGRPAWWYKAAPGFAAQAAIPLLASPATAVPLPVIGFDHPYYPSAALCLGTVAVVLLLTGLARLLPVGVRPATGDSPPGARPIWFYLVGLTGIFLLFFISWGFPNFRADTIALIGSEAHPIAVRPRAIVPILVLGAAVVLFAWLVWRMARRGAGWSDGRGLALAAGGLSFFILFTPVHEFCNTNPSKNMHGMLGVGIAWVIFLVLLGMAIRRRGRRAAEAARQASNEVAE